MEDASLVQFGPYSLRPESPNVVVDRDNVAHKGCRIWLDFTYVKKNPLGSVNGYMLEPELAFLQSGVAADCPACVLILDALTTLDITEDKLRNARIKVQSVYSGPHLKIGIEFGETKLEVFHAKGVYFAFGSL
jgi:hypothetical protein